MNYKRFRKKSAYSAEKENKRQNFIYINSKYCEKNQTVIAGDSITEICNMELFNSYIEKSGLKVYNRGISGDTSDRFLERFDDTVLALEPKNLVLLIGTNDFSINADVDFVFNNIEQIIIKTKSKLESVNIILQSVYPVNYKNKIKNRKILELNSKLSDLSNKYNITYVDVHSLLLDEKGGFNQEYTYDGLHPNVKGFEVAFEQIFISI